jgi:predicted signal transduction protein with EAL and GGDEF domain/DNA-binding response OmpR family regulator
MVNSADNQPVVLLIDDDQTLHLWAERHFRAGGFQLISCFDGESGLNAFQAQAPEIVILDIEMPIMDGFSTCSAIRALPEGKIVPIIMMTVTEDGEQIRRTYDCGATDFLLKPISWEVLMPRLYFMLEASKNLTKLRLSEMRLSKAKKMAKLGDWEWSQKNDALYWSDEVYDLVETCKQDFTLDSHNFKRFIHRADLSYVNKKIKEILDSKQAADLEFRIITAKQHERFVTQQIEPVENSQKQLTGLIGTVQDITERKEQEIKIRHLAYYDEVTELPNRVYFLTFLAKTIEICQRNHRNFAILFLDLDGFKGINDTYGHQVGDELLKQISERLTKELRCSDLTSRYFDHFDNKLDVARFGGDEFIILLNELANPEDAALVAERIQRCINQPVTLGKRTVHIGVSIGIATFPEDGQDSTTLLKHADIAMYHAKKMGKSHYQFFRQEMAINAQKRLKMESYMHLAVSKNELRLHYQPVVDVETGRLIGAEALMRWQHPKLGFLPPNDFISLAEENGIIIRFGEWAIREVCRQYKLWQKSGIQGLTVSVNLSSLQFNQPDFIDMVDGIFREFDMDPKFIIFELTESMIMVDTDNMMKKLKDLKALGIKLSVDDFGTGYSSLRYLNRFPLDSLKIDRSFIRELPANSDAAAIVSAILALAKALNLKTVAEGVETLQQKHFLENSSCNALQGFYFSKPMPVEEFENYWATESAKA